LTARGVASFGIIGAGAWGTALACHAARLGHTVTLWALEPEVAEEITTRHTNSVYLPATHTHLREILTGTHAGLYVHPGEPGLAIGPLPAA